MKRESDYDFLRERNIIVIISCRIIFGLTQSLFMPYFSLFVLAQEGVTPKLLGIIISTRAVSRAIISPLAGHLTDALGRKKVMVVGTILRSFSYLFYVFATGFRMVFIGSLIEGLVFFYLPAMQAITQDSLKWGARGLGLSTTSALQTLPRLISPFIGGVLAEQFGIDKGMRIGFTLAFGAGLVVAFIRLKFLQETVDQTTEKVDLKNIVALTKLSYKKMYSLLFEYTALRGLITLSLLNTFFGAIASPFWIVYAKTVVGINTVEWGLITSIAAGVNTLVLFFTGRFVDRFGRKKIMLINFLIAPITILFFIYCQNFLQMLIFQIVLTIQNAFITPASAALLADIIPRESRGRAIAAIGGQPVSIAMESPYPSFFRFPPSFVGSALSGYVFGLDPQYPWFFLVGAYALESVICHFLIKDPEKPAD